MKWLPTTLILFSVGIIYVIAEFLKQPDDKKYPNKFAVSPQYTSILYSSNHLPILWPMQSAGVPQVKYQPTQAEYEEFLNRAGLVLGLDKVLATPIALEGVC